MACFATARARSRAKGKIARIACQRRFLAAGLELPMMKLFATAADPTKPVGEKDSCKPDGMRPVAIGEGTGFRSVCTDTYQLNFMEVPSGVKIILNTSPGAGNVRTILERFYQEVFVALVVKDPVQQPGNIIENNLFEEEVEAFFQKTGFL